MELIIKELAAKAQWLQRLSALLRQARIAVPGSWDVRRRRFEVTVERIDWEAYTIVNRNQQMIWQYPLITTQLAVSPVTAYAKHLSDGHQPEQQERISDLRLRGNLLELVTNNCLTRLNLAPDAGLEARDTAVPAAGRFSSDRGRPAAEMRGLCELLRAEVL